MITVLVVEEADRDMAMIDDTICSMQHRYVRYKNQEDAPIVKPG